MDKFNKMLTETGDKLIAKRANTLSEEAKDEFEEELRITKKKIRELKNEITSMEDLSVRNTQTLVVGENLNVKEWTKRRISIELELKDLRYEEKVIKALIEDYFEDDEDDLDVETKIDTEKAAD